MRPRSGSSRHRSKPDQGAARVGARVRRLRLEAGFNFDAFVEETRLGRGYVSELERGLVVPSLTALEAMAQALELTVADLVLGSSDRERLFDRARHLGAPDLDRLLRLVDKLRPPSAVTTPPSLPFKETTEVLARRHKAGLPLLSLQASAGVWSAPQALSVAMWVIVQLRIKGKRGLFVAQAVGRSMEPGIPDGAYCLFQRPWSAPQPREAGLFVRWEDERTGAFTLKEYRPSLGETEAGDVVGGALHARNPAHPPLLPTPLADAPERPFARLLRVLP